MSAAAACSRASPRPAASCSPRSSRRVRGALAAYPTGADAMPNGVVSNPKVFVSIAPRRHRQHRRGARRDGQRRGAHRAADDRRRRARRRLGARARGAVAGRREDLRQPGHRRLAQRAPLHPADAPVRRGGAHDAGAGRGQEMGRAGGEVQAQQHEVVHKPSGRKLGYGELAADAAALPVPAARQDQAQGGERLPLHRQGQRRASPTCRHHHRQGDVRTGHRAARHEVRGDRAGRRWSAARSRRSTPARR